MIRRWGRMRMEFRFGKSGRRGEGGHGRWRSEEVKRWRGRRRCGYSRVWSLSLGSTSYPISKPHLLIHSFPWPWGCCEVRCELEKWNNLSATSYVEHLVVDDDNALDSSAKSDTGEGEFKNNYRSTSSKSTTLWNQQSIRPSSPFCPSTTYSNARVKWWALLRQHTSVWHTKTAPGSGANWSLVRRTCSLIYQLPPPVCGRSAEKTTVTWFRKAQGDGRRFEKIRAESKRWINVDVWSDGFFLWVNFLGGWVRAGNLKHGVYVVLLSALDCVRRYWSSKQDFFEIYLPPHSTYFRDFETKESFTGISCSILGLFRIPKEGEFRECDLNLERYATNHVAGPMAPLSSSHSTPQSSHWPTSHVVHVLSLPTEWILPLQVLWIRLMMRGTQFNPFHWLHLGYRRLSCPPSEKCVYLFPFSVSVLRTSYPRLAHRATFSESALGPDMVFPRHGLWLYVGVGGWYSGERMSFR